MPTRPGFAAYCLLAAALAAVAGVQTGRTYADPRGFGGGDPGLPFNADFLAVPTLVEDALAGYPVRTFRYSACTFAVPDVAAYAAVRAVGFGPRAAIVPWQLALSGLLVASAAFAAASVLPPAVRRWAWPLTAVWAAGYLGHVTATLAATKAHDLLLPVCHNGAQTVAFVAVGLTARLVRATRPRSRAGLAVGVGLVAAAGVFSDRLFALCFAAPAVAGLAAVRLLTGPAGRAAFPVTGGKLALVTLATAAGCAAGLVALKAIDPPGDPDPIGTHWGGQALADNLPTRAANLGRVFGVELADGNGLVAAAGVALAGGTLAAAGGLVRRGGPGAAAGAVFYQAYAVAAAGGTCAVFVVSLTGRRYLDVIDPHPWGHFSRYFTGPLAAGLLAGPVWAAATRLSPARWVRAAGLVVPAGAAGWLLVPSTTTPRPPALDLLDPYPEFVKAVDAVCRPRGLTDGLGGYWEAKPVTRLSRAGVRVHPVETDPAAAHRVRPFVWLDTAAAYWPPPGDGPADPYQFVLAAPGLPADAVGLDIPEAAAVAAFGPPAEAVPVGRFRLLVYNRPADAGLARFADADHGALVWKHRAAPGRVTRFPGAGFRRPTGAAVEGTGLVAAEGVTPAGYMAAGPDLAPAAAGPLTVTFRVRAAGVPAADATVDVYATDPATGVGRLVAVAPVPPDAAGDIKFGFDVTRQMLGERLQFRTHYPGRGRLAVEWVDVAAGR